MASRLPIKTLIELADDRTTTAARKLAALRSAKLDASRKLDLLRGYRAEYARQLQDWMQAGLPSAQLRNFKEFLQVLDRGIAQQQAAADQAGARLEQGRAHWQDQRRRLGAFETLAERMRQQQQLALNRHDQRASDERAARIVFDRAARA